VIYLELQSTGVPVKQVPVAETEINEDPMATINVL
jgi:hypothetical protein